MCNFFYFCYNLNILLHVWTAWFTSDKGGKCDCPRCLSVSKIIQKRVHGFQTGVRTWTNWSPFFSPIQIIVQIQELDLHRIFPFEQDYSKHMHGFGWNVACRQMLGHGRTYQLLSPIWIIVQMPEPDCFLQYRMHCNAEFYYVGENHTYRYWAPVTAARRSFKMVLFTASRGNTFVGGTYALPSGNGNTFVGGTCALPSAFLVI